MLDFGICLALTSFGSSCYALLNYHRRADLKVDELHDGVTNPKGLYVYKNPISQQLMLPTPPLTLVTIARNSISWVDVVLMGAACVNMPLLAVIVSLLEVVNLTNGGKSVFIKERVISMYKGKVIKQANGRPALRDTDHLNIDLSKVDFAEGTGRYIAHHEKECYFASILNDRFGIKWRDPTLTQSATERKYTVREITIDERGMYVYFDRYRRCRLISQDYKSAVVKALPIGKPLLVSAATGMLYVILNM